MRAGLIEISTGFLHYSYKKSMFTFNKILLLTGKVSQQLLSNSWSTLRFAARPRPLVTFFYLMLKHEGGHVSSAPRHKANSQVASLLKRQPCIQK